MDQSSFFWDIFLLNVKFKDCCKKLKLYIIKEGGAPIVGRDWLKVLDIF